jgi:tonB-linked outer membrane protein, susC/ragA family
MKKKWMCKILRYMRNLFLLLLISASSIWARDGYSQKSQEIFSVKSGTIESIFRQIKKQSGYEFFYNTAVLDVKENVSLATPNGTLEDILSQVLGNKYSYSIRDNYILISGKKHVLPDEVKKIVIKGLVKDRKGESLPGVSVLLKGTTVGVATDVKGEFMLTIPAQDTIVLRFTFIGMKTKDVVYRAQEKPIVVVLEESATEVEEVIVTGYQEIKKERMTGSVEVVTSKDIANKGYTSVEDVLKGQMAGVAVMNLSGRPGAQARIRIRGINSLTGDTNPIWIVDGMPLTGNVPEVSMGGTEFEETVLTSGIGNIPPDDIESITVLKDAAATAIYGSRAANGVIVVTTKRGTVGRSYINVQVSYGLSEAPDNRLKMMNTKEKIAFERGIYEDFPGLNVGGRVYQLLKKVDNGLLTKVEAETEIERLSKINTNWFDKIFRVAHTQNYSISLSGGNETTQYYGSLSYLSQEGVMPNNKYESMGASMKLTHDFNKFLRVHFDVRSSLRNDRSSASPVNPLDYATYANTYERLYDEEGNYDYDRSSFSELSSIRDGYRYDFNILKDLNDNTTKSRYVSNQVSLKLEFKIMEGLMLSSMGTFSNSNNHSMRELVPGSYASKRASWLAGIYTEGEITDDMNNGMVQESTSRSQQWTIRNQLEFARGFSGGDHYVNAYLGQEVSSSKGYGFTSMIPEWSDVYGVASYPDLTGVTLKSSFTDLLAKLGAHSETQDRSASFFMTGSYSYKDRYVVQGSVRLDGVDIIGTDNRFSPLWNVSGKWNVHNESFMTRFGFINQLAFRVSYGFVGSIDRNALPFSVLRKVSNYSYNGEKIMDRYDPSNPSIKWQRQENRNIGFDASLLNNRINLVVNYYDNDTRNLLDDKKIAASTGRLSVAANVASVNNRGWEISLRTLNVRTTDFSWVTSVNFTKNKDKVTETYYQDLSEVSASTNSTFESIYNLYIQGRPVKAFYGYKYAGVDPYTGNSLAYVDGFDDDGNRLGTLTPEGKYVYNMDNDLTTQLANSSRGYLGRSDPPITGGFTTQFNYKRFSLFAQFTYMTGHLARSFQYYVSGGTTSASARNLLKIEANRWRKPGDMTDVPKYGTSRTEYLYQLFDFRFEKGDYLKCNNISLGYNLDPALCAKLYITRARLNLNMANVFTLTKFRGIDPETKGAFTYPSARTYSFTLSIGI